MQNFLLLLILIAVLGGASFLVGMLWGIIGVIIVAFVVYVAWNILIAFLACEPMMKLYKLLWTDVKDLKKPWQ